MLVVGFSPIFRYMLEALISSKTRIKLLVKFFLNPEAKAYLRSMETEFNESTNSIRIELNRFEKAGMLKSSLVGNRKIFKAETNHPLFNELRMIILKHTGIDTIIESVIKRLGNVDKVYLTGDLAKGSNSEIIDLIIIGVPDKVYLLELIDKAEKIIKRKIRFLTYIVEDEVKSRFETNEEYLLLWDSGKLG